MNDEHSHYWFPVPAYRRENGETSRCNCGAVEVCGRIIEPNDTQENPTP